VSPVPAGRIACFEVYAALPLDNFVHIYLVSSCEKRAFFFEFHDLRVLTVSTNPEESPSRVTAASLNRAIGAHFGRMSIGMNFVPCSQFSKPLHLCTEFAEKDNFSKFA
jgi:hypothetical protein